MWKYIARISYIHILDWGNATMFHSLASCKQGKGKASCFFWSNCYAVDQLEKLGFDDENSSTNKATLGLESELEKNDNKVLLKYELD